MRIAPNTERGTAHATVEWEERFARIKGAAVAGFPELEVDRTVFVADDFVEWVLSARDCVVAVAAIEIVEA